MEAEAERDDGLRYIGSHAVLARLGEKKVAPLPSTASIERVLSAAQMTRPYRRAAENKERYPHLPGETSFPTEGESAPIAPRILTEPYPSY